LFDESHLSKGRIPVMFERLSANHYHYHGIGLLLNPSRTGGHFLPRATSQDYARNFKLGMEVERKEIKSCSNNGCHGYPMISNGKIRKTLMKTYITLKICIF